MLIETLRGARNSRKQLAQLRKDILTNPGKYVGIGRPGALDKVTSVSNNQVRKFGPAASMVYELKYIVAATIIYVEQLIAIKASERAYSKMNDVECKTVKALSP